MMKVIYLYNLFLYQWHSFYGLALSNQFSSCLDIFRVFHNFIAHLSSLLTKILTVIKIGPEKYCSVKTSHTGVNNMWILKNSKKSLSSLGHLGVYRTTSIQTLIFLPCTLPSLPSHMIYSSLV